MSLLAQGQAGLGDAALQARAELTGWGCQANPAWFPQALGGFLFIMKSFGTWGHFSISPRAFHSRASPPRAAAAAPLAAGWSRIPHGSLLSYGDIFLPRFYSLENTLTALVQEMSTDPWARWQGGCGAEWGDQWHLQVPETGKCWAGNSNRTCGSKDTT